MGDVELDPTFLAHPKKEREGLSTLFGKVDVGIGVVDSKEPDFLHPHPHRHRKGHRTAIAEDEIEADELPHRFQRIGDRSRILRISQ